MIVYKRLSVLNSSKAFCRTQLPTDIHAYRAVIVKQSLRQCRAGTIEFGDKAHNSANMFFHFHHLQILPQIDII